MVYYLIFGVTSFLASILGLFVVNIIPKKSRLKRKKKIIWVLKVFRLASITSVITTIIVLFLGQIIAEAHSSIYTIYDAEQRECYHTQIDPASFPKETIERGIILSGNGVESSTSKIAQPNGISKSDEIPQSNETSQPDEMLQFNGISQPDEVPQSNETSQYGTEKNFFYDFSVLMIFGEYQFGEYITPKDLLDMRIMYNEFWKNEMYWDMLKQDNKTGVISGLQRSLMEM